MSGPGCGSSKPSARTGRSCPPPAWTSNTVVGASMIPAFCSSRARSRGRRGSRGLEDLLDLRLIELGRDQRRGGSRGGVQAAVPGRWTISVPSPWRVNAGTLDATSSIGRNPPTSGDRRITRSARSWSMPATVALGDVDGDAEVGDVVLAPPLGETDAGGFPQAVDEQGRTRTIAPVRARRDSDMVAGRRGAFEGSRDRCGETRRRTTSGRRRR